MAIRLLSSFRNNLKDCNLHPDLKALTSRENGLVIISGPTGSGKSTTLAALIEEVNTSQSRHILTIEDPIEYYLENARSFIRQREVHTHTPSFEQGITDAMREDPDVLVIGEMRTQETMRLTLNAAETGHLVLATMHSARASEALSRIEMSFAPESQGSIRAQLADSLVGVVSQRLVYLPDEKIRVPQCELLMASTQVKSLVRSGQFAKLESAIQTGRDDGMWTFERYLGWINGKQHWVKPTKAETSAPPAIEVDTTSELLAKSRENADELSRSSLEPGAPLVTRGDSARRIVIDEAETDLDALVEELSETAEND